MDFLMASELISDDHGVCVSGKELASENDIQECLKEIKELDGDGGVVRLCSCLWFPRSHQTD
jgi:hypothetical protein